MRETDLLFAMAAIRKALSQSPQAKDTAKGVHEFWIPWEEPRPYIAVTIRALEQLRDLGEIEAIRQKEGRTVWCLKRCPD